MRKRFHLLVLTVALMAARGAMAQPAFALHDGNRVVFFGDSITDQRLYTTFTETYVVTRFPRMNVTMVHSGWGGDRVTGGSGGPDDEAVGTFPADRLAQGIDLAELVTPMMRQAAEVHALTRRRNNIHAARWRAATIRAATGVPSGSGAFAYSTKLHG